MTVFERQFFATTKARLFLAAGLIAAVFLALVLAATSSSAVIYGSEKEKQQRKSSYTKGKLSKELWVARLTPAKQLIAEALHSDPHRHLTREEALKEINRISAKSAPILSDQENDSEGYSTGVNHEQVPSHERVLDIESFNDLPAKGQINPNRLRTAQPGIEMRFREQKYGTIYDLANKLIASPKFAAEIEPVGIGVYRGRVWSFDTRRVVAFQMAHEKNAQVNIRYIKLSRDQLLQRVKDIYEGREWMGLVTAVRNDGKKSGSTPHTNPAYEEQLGESVNEKWLYDKHTGFPEQDEPADNDNDAKDTPAGALSPATPEKPQRSPAKPYSPTKSMPSSPAIQSTGDL